MTIHIKMRFPHDNYDELRSLKLPESPTPTIQSLFDYFLKDHQPAMAGFLYRDEDGERVTLTTDSEMATLWESLILQKSSSAFRLDVWVRFPNAYEADDVQLLEENLLPTNSFIAPEPPIPSKSAVTDEIERLLTEAQHMYRRTLHKEATFNKDSQAYWSYLDELVEVCGERNSADALVEFGIAKRIKHGIEGLKGHLGALEMHIERQIMLNKEVHRMIQDVREQSHPRRDHIRRELYDIGRQFRRRSNNTDKAHLSERPKIFESKSGQDKDDSALNLSSIKEEIKDIEPQDEKPPQESKDSENAGASTSDKDWDVVGNGEKANES